jgi:DHA2 family multidrug resistance protein-like MFS transporter
MPSTLALISTMFPGDRDRGRAIAVWATCQFAGGALGPVLAGALLAHFWWGSVFLVAVPAMLVLLVLGPLVLPEHRDPSAGRLDLPSVALSLSAMLSMVYGLKQLAVADPRHPAVPLVTLAVGASLGVVFVRRQLTLTTPLLDLRLFRNRQFTAVLVALVFAGVAMAGTGLEVTQYLQSVLGHSPLASAVLFAPMGLGVAAGTFTAPVLIRWMTPTTAIAGGLVVSALGGVALARTEVVAGIFVLALGTGPLFALGTSLVVGSVPPRRAGSAASMSETSNYVGGSLGIAVLGMVAGAVYRARMSGTPGTAGQTLAGAIETGRPEVVHAAKAAFTAGLSVTGLVAAVIFATLSIVVAVRRPEAEPASASASASVSESVSESESASESVRGAAIG